MSEFVNLLKEGKTSEAISLTKKALSEKLSEKIEENKTSILVGLGLNEKEEESKEEDDKSESDDDEDKEDKEGEDKDEDGED